MFEKINKRAFYRQRHLDAPLLNERIEYLEYLESCGKALSSLKEAADYLLRVVELLNLNKKRTVSRQEIEDGAVIWAQYQYNHPQKQQSFSITSKEKFIQYATAWLSRINCLEKPPKEIALFYEIFEREHAIKRHLTAPFLKERIKYLENWQARGASVRFLRVTAQYLLRVIEYLNITEESIVTINEINEAANKWAAYQYNHPSKTIEYSDCARIRFVKHAKGWLGMSGMLNLPDKKPMPFARYLSEYTDYMRHEKELSEVTIFSRTFLLENFLGLVYSKTKTFRHLNINIVDEIISFKSNSGRYCRRSIQLYVSVIRAFIRFAEGKVWCNKGLSEAIKIARSYRHESLPYSPPWDEVKKLISKTEGNNHTAIRDHAILLLLSVYGLRRIEVARLTLDDIDWENKRIFLNRAKGCKPQVFPLSETVGNAILRYIKEVRRDCCKFRNIFTTKRAPIVPLSPGAIYAIVHRRWEGADLNIKHKGPHALRHACATHLINNGVSLKEISSHLGHSDMEATRIYAKVDLVSLRKVADFKIGGLL